MTSLYSATNFCQTIRLNIDEVKTIKITTGVRGQ